MADRKALFFNAGSFELIDESGDVLVAPDGGVKLGSTTALSDNSGSLEWGGAGVAMSADLGSYATQAYVDGLVQGLSIKNSVVVATTGNIADLASGAPDTVDSISLAADDRVLVMNQSTGSQNGIYKVDTLGTGSNGVWSRVDDMAAAADASGAFTFIEEGTYADTGFVCTNDSGNDTVATHDLVFTQFSGAGAYTGGDGLTLSGADFSVNVDDSTIEISADTLQLKALGIDNSHISGTAGIAVTKLNIAGGTNLGSASLHQTEDEFLFSDNGTNKVVSFSNLEDSIFANISGDATVAAGGALTLGAGVVENSMLADNAVDSDELADNAVLSAHIADGAIDTAAFIANDLISNDHMAADAITGAELADNAVDSEHYTDGSIDPEHVANGFMHGAEEMFQISVTSGEAFSIGMPVYLKATDGKAYKAISDSGEEARVFGIALEAASGADEAKNVMVSAGIQVTIPAAGRDGTLAEGNLVYCDSTAGQLTTGAPGSGEWACVAGMAAEDNVVVLWPGQAPVQVP